MGIAKREWTICRAGLDGGERRHPGIDGVLKFVAVHAVLEAVKGGFVGGNAEVGAEGTGDAGGDLDKRVQDTLCRGRGMGRVLAAALYDSKSFFSISRIFL